MRPKGSHGYPCVLKLSVSISEAFNRVRRDVSCRETGYQDHTIPSAVAHLIWLLGSQITSQYTSVFYQVLRVGNVQTNR
jgi:hypothetical protein